MSDDTSLQEFASFLSSWKESGQEMAKVYESLYEAVAALPGVSFSFMPRPGLTYSLRPVQESQKERTFFAIMDVIDDEPEERWLSICFYGDMVTDPEERGDLVPNGLGNADGYCFDMYSPDAELTAYLVDRIKQAHASALAS